MGIRRLVPLADDGPRGHVSPTMGPGGTFTHTFRTVGTFRYLCTPHNGDGMIGEVVVTPRG